MGLRQLKSGKWQADYHDRRKRIRKSFALKSQAKDWLAVNAGKRANGEQVGRDRTKIVDCFKFWKKWLPIGDGHPRSPGYIRRVETVLKSLLPWLAKKGCYEVSSLDVGIIRQYRSYRVKMGRRPQTILNEIRTLLACLSWNLKNGSLKNNPLQHHKPGGNVVHKVRTVPKPDELQAVFDCLPSEDIKKIYYPKSRS